MASGSVQLVSAGRHVRPGYLSVMDTHDTKAFPSDAMSASDERGDSTAVMYAAESLGGRLLPPADLPAPGRGRGHGGHARHVHGRQPRGRWRPRSRTREVFSSEGFLELGNVRPLIPLSVDPPRHLKYRKILDPIFAPAADGRDRGRRHRAGEPLHRPVRSTAASATSRNEFAEQFPSAVFLGLMGLPWEELDTFLRLKDGIIRPGGIEMDPEERQQIQRDIGQELYAYFDAHPRRAPRSHRRTTSSPGSTPRRSTARS